MTGQSIQPQFAGVLGTSGKALGITAGLAGSYLTADAIKPYVLKGVHDVEEKTPQDTLAPEVKARITAQRQQGLTTTLFNTYIQNGPGVINWYHLVDIIDYIARNTSSDKDFKEDLWSVVVGWQPNGERAPLVQYLDPNNTGLPTALHNTGYASEQMHHLLGAVTGNTDKIPSHLQLNKAYAFAYELPEIWKRGHYNWGDVRLFLASQKLRDDFLKQGRMSVAPNIRALLVPPMPQLPPAAVLAQGNPVAVPGAFSVSATPMQTVSAASPPVSSFFQPAL